MDSIFNGRLSFLNVRLEKIGELIKAEDYKTALLAIEEVLEWAPRSGELYWKKVLAIQECKDGVELLHKGSILQNITAFVNVKKCTDKDKPVYSLISNIEKVDTSIKTRLKKELDDKEREEKQNTRAKDKLDEFKQTLTQTAKTAQKNIERLESVEKSIHEQVMACTAVSEEYKYALEAVCSTAAEIQRNFSEKNDMTLEEKHDGEFQVDMILSESDTALDFLQHLISDHPAFLEYLKLKDEQQSIKEEIEKNNSAINRIQLEINELVDSLKKISRNYEDARIAVNDGSYKPAKTMLPQGLVEEIINQALKPAKTTKS